MTHLIPACRGLLSRPATGGSVAALLLLACTADPTAPGGADTPPPPPPPASLPVSPAVVSASPAALPAGTGSFVNGLAPVAWVSMAPGTDTAAASVVITPQGGGAEVEVQAADGGFDPVPVPASGGGTRLIAIKHHSGPTALGYATVPLESRPIIIRTSPPKGKTDVPLNAVIVVIFSEPMDSASLSTAVTLRWSGGQVPATVRPAPVFGNPGLAAEVTPATPLLPATTYALEVDTAATSALGATLDSTVRVEFTTDTTPTDTLPPPVDTLPPPPTSGDTTAPVVTILSPLSGDTVPRRLLPMLVQVDEDQGMSCLSFSVLGTQSPWGTYDACWSSPTSLMGRVHAYMIVPDPAAGTYTLQVSARDAAGNVGTSAPVVVTAVDPDTTPRIIVRSFEVIEFQDSTAPGLPWDYVPKLTVAEQPGGTGLEIVSIETLTTSGSATMGGGPLWARSLKVSPGADLALFLDLYGDYEIVIQGGARASGPWRMRLTYRDAVTHHYYATTIEGAIVPGPSSPASYSGGCGHWSESRIIPESVYPWMFTGACGS